MIIFQSKNNKMPVNNVGKILEEKFNINVDLYIEQSLEILLKTLNEVEENKICKRKYYNKDERTVIMTNILSKEVTLDDIKQLLDSVGKNQIITELENGTVRALFNKKRDAIKMVNEFNGLNLDGVEMNLSIDNV